MSRSTAPRFSRRPRQRSAWLIVAPFLLLPFSFAAGAADGLTGTVRRVLDGDTVIVQTSTKARLRCRLSGIDAPEVSHRSHPESSTPAQPYGSEARGVLAGMALARTVTVEVRGRDQFRRELCILWASGRNLNLEMVRQGYAWADRWNSPDVPRDLRRDLIVAEDEARRAGRGLWTDSNPEPPWIFRQRTRFRTR